MKVSRWGVLFFLAGVVAYAIASRALFQMPATLAEAEACGFTPQEFTGGQLNMTVDQAWRLRFIRQQEYLSALSMGVVVAFVAFAVGKVRQIGGAAMAGSAAGGGVLALLSLCASCLGPTLTTVVLGLSGSLVLDIPKWLMTLTTAVFTGWGYLFLQRRATCCPAVPAASGCTKARAVRA